MKAVCISTAFFMHMYLARIAFFLIFVGSILPGVAQLSKLEIGGELSSGLSILGVKNDFSENEGFQKHVNPISYGLLATIEYPIRDDIKVQTGLGFTSKTISIDYFSTSDSLYSILNEAFNRKLNYNATYLRIPITGKYYYDLFDDPNMKPFGQFGFALDFGLNDASPGGNGVNQELDFQYHKGLDVSTIFGAGLEIKTRDDSYLTIGIQFHKGWLNSVTDSYGEGQNLIRLRNNQLLFTLGLRMSDIIQ